MRESCSPFSKLSGIALASVLLLAIAACGTELFSFSDGNQPRHGLPLLSTSFTLAEALGEEDFSGRLVLDDTLRLKLIDTVFNRRIINEVDIEPLPIPLTDTVSTFDLEELGVDIPFTELAFASGQLRFAAASRVSEPLMVRFEVEEAILPNGEPSTATLMLDPNSDGEVAIPLAGKRLVIPEGRITVNYSALNAEGESQELRIAFMIFEDARPSAARGAFKNFRYPLGQESVETLFFRDFDPQSASLRDARVTINLRSTVSLPLSLRAARSFVVLRDGSELDFSSPLNEGVPIPASGEIGDTVLRSIAITPSNSDLIDAVSRFPDSVVFDLEVISNPDALDESFTIDGNDKVLGTFELDVPLDIRFEQFAVERDFASNANLPEGVTDVELVLTTENMIGLSAKLQLETLNAGEPAEALFDEPILVLAEADPVSATSGLGLARIPITPTQLETISGGDSLRATLQLSTLGGASDFTALRPQDTVQLSLAAEFQLER